MKGRLSALVMRLLNDEAYLERNLAVFARICSGRNGESIKIEKWKNISIIFLVRIGYVR